MTNIKTYADKVSRRAIADCVGVGMQAVSNAISAGHFPAAWFVTMRDAGLDPPECFFGWKGHVSSPSHCSTEIPTSADKMLDGANKVKGEP